MFNHTAVQNSALWPSQSISCDWWGDQKSFNILTNKQGLPFFLLLGYGTELSVNLACPSDVSFSSWGSTDSIIQHLATQWESFSIYFSPLHGLSTSPVFLLHSSKFYYLLPFCGWWLMFSLDRNWMVILGDSRCHTVTETRNWFCNLFPFVSELLYRWQLFYL